MMRIYEIQFTKPLSSDEQRIKMLQLGVKRAKSALEQEKNRQRFTKASNELRKAQKRITDSS